MCQYCFFLAFILAISLCAREFLRTYYQRIMKFNRFSQILLAVSFLYLLSVLLLIAVYRSNIQVWQIILVKVGIILTVVVPLFHRKNLHKGLGDIREAFRIMKESIYGSYRYLFGYIFILSLFSQLSVFSLRTFSDSYSLATFGSAFSYYSFLLIGLTTVKSVYLPAIQNTNSKKEISNIFRQHYLLLIVTTISIIIGILVSNWIIPFIDGGKYPNAILVFQVLCISALVSFAFSPFVIIVMKHHRFFHMLIITIIGFVINLGLNIVFIPKHGALGAALTHLLCFGIVNFVFYLYSKHLVRMDSMYVGV
jgi:O-antigen/teichoic acid export membrane protein